MRPLEWVRVFGLPIVLGVLLGLLGGWLWWTWWGPPLTGKVYETTDGQRHWFPDPLDPGLPHQFSGTGTFVIVAVGLGLLFGLVSGWMCRNRAVIGLLALLVGSVAASVIMVLFGQSLSPADPQAKVDQVKLGTKLPEHMETTWGEIDLKKDIAEFLHDDDRVIYVPTANLVWPAAALAGYLVLMLALPLERPTDDDSIEQTLQRLGVNDGSAPSKPA